MIIKNPLIIKKAKLQAKIATPTTQNQTITFDSGYDGLSEVQVEAVTSAIDSNITPTNIRAGITILGVAGNLEPDKPDQSKTVAPTTSSQTITADTGYELASVTINAVDNTIDSNITAENIKKDVTILGVTGTLEEGMTPAGTISISDNKTVDVTNYANASVDVKTGIPITPTYLYFKEINRITLKFSLLIATVCWGDGSVETFNSNGKVTIGHSYSDGLPNHVVTIIPNYQRYIDFGSSGTNLQRSIIFGQGNNTTLRKNIFDVAASNAMSNALVHVKFGSEVDFQPYAFAYCENLSIDLTKFNNNVAINQNGIKFPKFREPLGVVYIFYRSGTNTNVLTNNIIISDAVSYINRNIFDQSGYRYIIIERGGHTNGNYIIQLNGSFNMNLQRVLVPQEMLNYYQTATNWSQYASIMVGY